MKIGKKLARLAKKQGICPEWHDQLLDIDNQDLLIEMYLKGIDFCLSKDFPSNDFIRENFAGKMESHGIYLDSKFNLVNLRKVVALGKSEGRVEISSYNTAEIFVKHDSSVNITVKDSAFVVIDVFDNAKIWVHSFGKSNVLINKYQGAEVDFTQWNESRIKLVEKQAKTY